MYPVNIVTYPVDSAIHPWNKLLGPGVYYRQSKIYQENVEPISEGSNAKPKQWTLNITFNTQLKTTLIYFNL